MFLNLEFFIYNDMPSGTDAVFLLIAICAIDILSFLLITFLIISLIMNKKNPYVRGKEGNAINEKLEGLKNYIKDYSNLEEKNKEDITLWEDYLIYSIIFGINTQIVEEVWEKICQ